MNRDEHITPHFKWGEFIRAQDPEPPLLVQGNLKRLAEALEGVREKLGGKPIRITSGYRTEAHNAAVGGEKNSFHLKGLAADIVVSGMTPQQVQEALSGWKGGMGSYRTFTHLDIRSYVARWRGNG